MTENNVENQNNFHQIFPKRKEFSRMWEHWNERTGLALSQKCINSAAEQTRRWRDWFWLVDVNQFRHRRNFQFNAAGENQNWGLIYGVYQRCRTIDLEFRYIYQHIFTLLYPSTLVGKKSDWMDYFLGKPSKELSRRRPRAIGSLRTEQSMSMAWRLSLAIRLDL